MMRPGAVSGATRALRCLWHDAPGGGIGERCFANKQLELQALCLQLHQVRVATSIVLALRGCSEATSTIAYSCVMLQQPQALRLHL
eukprot:1172615-Prymnesium_polylepis.1